MLGTVIEICFFKIMKVYSVQRDLTNISAKIEPLANIDVQKAETSDT